MRALYKPTDTGLNATESQALCWELSGTQFCVFFFFFCHTWDLSSPARGWAGVPLPIGKQSLNDQTAREVPRAEFGRP